MPDLIDLRSYPVWNVLDILLQDKTTKQNIIWATDTYMEDGKPIEPKKQITKGALLGIDSHEIQPRVYKSLEMQAGRTKSRAEVFTPSWVCNKMNNHLDEEWFGRKDVFNKEDGQSWIVNEDAIQFGDTHKWTDYVDSKRLEITCGEAPYLVSRYDTTTGETIPIPQRIGLLDRKLRVVGENADNVQDWITYAVKAFQSCYGYEYQGDNLLIARINILMTFEEYLEDKWNIKADEALLKKIANIIAWNIWQMDGLTGTVPMGEPVKEKEQIGFDLFGDLEEEQETKTEPCRIYDWKANKSITYNSIKKGGR